jgi:uncharacterized membrane protein YphA (DoxX/SURF4 family)
MFFMRIAVNIIRVLVGLLLIFSGLVKANDPIGLSLKMEEFFEVWNTMWANKFSLALSVFMIAFEIIAGVALLVGWKFKQWTLAVLLMMIFFTFLTGYAAYSGKFKTCGCFGDCLPIPAKASFIKDIILTLMILLLFIKHRLVKPIMDFKWCLVVLLCTTVFSFLIQNYALSHLPFKDCLSFKEGNNILAEKVVVAGKKELTFFYKKDGKEYTYTDNNFPTWIEDTTYVFDRREEKVLSTGNEGSIMRDFNLTTEFGNDTTQQLFSEKGNLLFVFVNTIVTEADAYMKELLDLATETKAKNIPLFVVTNLAEENRPLFSKMGVQVLFCDKKPIVAAARTTPAAMFTTDATIMWKYSYNDFNKAIRKVKAATPNAPQASPSAESPQTN